MRVMSCYVRYEPLCVLRGRYAHNERTIRMVRGFLWQGTRITAITLHIIIPAVMQALRSHYIHLASEVCALFLQTWSLLSKGALSRFPRSLSSAVPTTCSVVVTRPQRSSYA